MSRCRSKYYGARKTAHLRQNLPKGPVFYQSRVRSFEREGTVIAPLQTGEDMIWVEFDHAQAQDASAVTVRDLEIIGWDRLQCAVEMLPLKPDPAFNFGCPVASFAAEPSAKLPSIQLRVSSCILCCGAECQTAFGTSAGLKPRSCYWGDLWNADQLLRRSSQHCGL